MHTTRCASSVPQPRPILHPCETELTPDPMDVPGNYSRVIHSENISYVLDKGLGPGATKTKRGGPYLQRPRGQQ